MDYKKDIIWEYEGIYEEKTNIICAATVYRGCYDQLKRTNCTIYYVMILDFLLLIGKVLRSSKPYKIRKVKVIIKGLWKVIWFSPQIEFAE